MPPPRSRRFERRLSLVWLRDRFPGLFEDVSLITYKSKREIAKMRASGQVIAQVFEIVLEMVRPGVTTGEIDQRVEEHIRGEDGSPSFLGYHGFPGSVCSSVNEEIVHGIPGDRALKEGDILTIDVGVVIKGYHADAARSFPVGSVSDEVRQLALVTADGLEAGIRMCHAGNRLSQVSKAIEEVARDKDYGVVEEYVGHGIGKALHEEPQVPNYVGQGGLKNDLVLRKGLVIAIEPMFNLGSKLTRTLSDKWTVVTVDGRPSAHFEDTVAITEDGPEILTRFPGGELLTGW